MTNPIIPKINGVEVKVGQVWERVDGDIIVITSFQNHDVYPIVSNKEIYTANGKAISYRDKSVGDLIKLIGHLTPIDQVDKTPENVHETQTCIPDKDGWIKWNGGECPVHPDTVVDVKLRSGHTEYKTTNKFLCWRRMVDGTEYPYDVIAYRIVTPHAKQPEAPRKLVLSDERLIELAMQIMFNVPANKYPFDSMFVAVRILKELIENIEANPELMERVR